VLPRQNFSPPPSAAAAGRSLVSPRCVHHHQLDAVLFGSLGRSFPCIPLIHIGELDMVAGHLLHLPGQLADLGAILFVGRSQ
jgi:hypothetical protein